MGEEEILHEVIQEHLGRKARNRSLQRVLAGFGAWSRGLREFSRLYWLSIRRIHGLCNKYLLLLLR